MHWLRNKLRHWLAVNKSEADIYSRIHGVENLLSRYERRLTTAESTLRDATTGLIDVAYKENSVVIIASKLGGGYISIRTMHAKNMAELRQVTRDLEARCRDVYIDVPYGYRRSV